MASVDLYIAIAEIPTLSLFDFILSLMKLGSEQFHFKMEYLDKKMHWNFDDVGQMWVTHGLHATDQWLF